LLGPAFRVTRQRGEFIQPVGLPLTMATVHPSSILRAPDEESRQLEMRAFIRDLRLAAERLAL
jgi:DNA polymerase